MLFQKTITTHEYIMDNREVNWYFEHQDDNEFGYLVVITNGRIDYELRLEKAELFEKLEKLGIRTHFLGTEGFDALLCRKLTIIPVEVIVRNIAAGSIVKTTTLIEGTLIQPPIAEYFLKDDAKDDPLLTYDRVRLMGIDPAPMKERALEINYHLQSLFTLMGIDLVDFKLEFGYDVHGDLYLADEMSPDNMRLWKRGTKERFDKDLFRKDEGDIVKAYKYILENLRRFA